MQEHHLPILLSEFLSFFREKSLSIFIDGTTGAGGHAYSLLQEHSEIKNFYGLDQDPDALEIAKNRLTAHLDRVHLIQKNFRYMRDLLPLASADGIFLDLGVSSMQLDRPEKGFSLYKEGPLDMRMDPHAPIDAAQVVNTFPEQELGRIFLEYGEEPRWKRAARAIVEARRRKPLRTTTDLCEALKGVLTWGGRRGKKIHPMTLVFQALRIYVNDELGALKEGLLTGIDLLKVGGRFGVISFHSLEDRVVKTLFREAAREGKVMLLTKKPLIATLAEVRQNPRSRSAKLRFIEKVA